MNTTLISATLTAIIFLLTGCGQKPDNAPTPKQAGETSAATERPTPQSPVSKTETRKPVTTEKTQVAPAESNPATPASKPQAAEDAITEVNKYGREKTRTQISKSRDRAQAAEDEMMQDMKGQK